jgi:hypothetical protein
LFCSTGGGAAHHGGGGGGGGGGMVVGSGRDSVQWRPGTVLVEARRPPWQRVPSTVVANQRRAPPCDDFFCFLVCLSCVSTLAHSKARSTLSQGGAICCFRLPCAGLGA